MGLERDKIKGEEGGRKIGEEEEGAVGLMRKKMDGKEVEEETGEERKRGKRKEGIVAYRERKRGREGGKEKWEEK